jgi:hypothetical protein
VGPGAASPPGPMGRVSRGTTACRSRVGSTPRTLKTKRTLPRGRRTKEATGEFADDAAREAYRAAHKGRCGHAARPNPPSRRWSTGPTPRPPTLAPSRPPALRATAAGSGTGPAPPKTSIRCAPSRRLRATRRQYGNDRSGWSRSVLRRRTGTGYGAAVAVAWGMSTAQGCSWRPDRTGSGGWRRPAGADIMPRAAA